jgi:hypothetical protein
MTTFTPAASWGAARKVAGISDARQVRDVKYGNRITYAKNRFLALMGDEIPGEDKRAKSDAPVIPSRAVKTLTPELFDEEVAPQLFRLTADSAAGAVGDSISLVLDDASGLEVGDKLGNPLQAAEARITAINGTTITAKIIGSTNGPIAWASVADYKNLEKMAGANGDAPAIGVGTYREKINRINGLQFSTSAMSQGVLQSNLSLYGEEGGEGANEDWKREVKNKMIDFARSREQNQIASQFYYSEGSGDSRIIHAKGLIGWAGGVVPNMNIGGALPYEDFVNVHMAAAREKGGSYEVWALGGLGISTVLTSYQQKQIRITSINEKYKAGITQIETPAGILKLVLCDFFDSVLRQGQMLTFMPDYLERCYLKGLDYKMAEGLELNNILGMRAALMVCEAMMSSNPTHIKLHTNIRKAG